MLHVSGVSKRFAARTVLSAVSLRVAAGEYVAVVGESGVGKSTLLNIIAGLEAPDSGEVSFMDSNIVSMDDDARTVFRREQFGFVFQAFHVLPHLTVEQNVGLPLLLRGFPSHEIQERSKKALAAVALATRENSMPRELSGGELQCIAIARALVGSPKLVLADEPTGNLDPETSAHVFHELLELIQHTGVAALMATHNLALASRMHRVLRLERGLLIETNPASVG